MNSVPSKSYFTSWSTTKQLTVPNSTHRVNYSPDILYKFEEESAIYNYKIGAEAVLDCKNKAYNIFSNADIYQIITYGSALQSDKAILIYPSFTEKENMYIDLDNELFSPNRVYGCFINIVDNTGEGFEQSISNFVWKLFEILDM